MHDVLKSCFHDEQGRRSSAAIFSFPTGSPEAERLFEDSLERVDQGEDPLKGGVGRLPVRLAGRSAGRELRRQRPV